MKRAELWILPRVISNPSFDSQTLIHELLVQDREEDTCTACDSHSQVSVHCCVYQYLLIGSASNPRPHYQQAAATDERDVKDRGCNCKVLSINLRGKTPQYAPDVARAKVDKLYFSALLVHDQISWCHPARRSWICTRNRGCPLHELSLHFICTPPAFFEFRLLSVFSLLANSCRYRVICVSPRQDGSER